MNKVYSVKNSNFNSKNHIIFICDHASSNIDRRYRKKFTDTKILDSHVSYDIGAKNLTLNLAKQLKQSCILSNFSRLLIDPNRNKTDKDLIVSTSFGIKIPINNNIEKKEKESRVKNFYNIYHNKISKLVNNKVKRYEKVFLISIHSFTKKNKTFNRGVEVGLLWNKNMKLLLFIQKKLSEFGIHYGRNFPYSGFHFNYTLDKHSKNGLIDNITIEIRNDLINNIKGINKYTELFSKILKELING
jgi:predicted N-formylglutamate amidohydrolase